MNPNTWLSGVAKDSTLTPTQRAAALALWTFMDKRGRCFPGMQAIGGRAGISKRDTVRTALAALEQRGHITIQIQPRGRLSTNEYQAVDNSARRPPERVTAVTRLADKRPPLKRVTQGPPSNGSRTFPEGTRERSDTEPVDNRHLKAIIGGLAHQHRIPN